MNHLERNEVAMRLFFTRKSLSLLAAAVKAVGQTRLKRVSSGELEVEHGCLAYSFDLRLKDRAGVEEVMIDAVSGEVLSVAHETPAQEKAEAAADRAPAAH